MNEFKNIERKLQQFIKKYYMNELIKGAIMFFSFGILYLLFTLFIEHFLWLKPTARTFLFVVFLSVETLLLFSFIASPILKLIGLKKGISPTESSRLIGRHFPEVKDKLLNILQLKAAGSDSDLLVASINQKSKELQPIPFVKAIDFTKNKKYLRYTIAPLLIWALIVITNNVTVFSNSLKRVVDFKTAYTPPAPFSFNLQNSSLKVIQGDDFEVTFFTDGDVVPLEATIYFNNQSYFLLRESSGAFRYTFNSVVSPLSFYVKANGVTSDNYTLSVINTPTIQNLSIALDFPRYLRIENKKIDNTGNIVVPEGTSALWTVNTKQTDSVVFINSKKKNYFKRQAKNDFVYRKTLRNNLNYQIATSNSELHFFENLRFQITVIKDAHPEIEVVSKIDSSASKELFFLGHISDDYGLQKLEAVYYDINKPNTKETVLLPMNKTDDQPFSFQFPGDLSLPKGVDFALFFNVYDNDGVSGSKKSTSQVFEYRNKTNLETEEEGLQFQKNQLELIERSLKNQQNQKDELKEIKNELQKKNSINWSDKKRLQNFIKRQEQYKQMMQRQTNKLQQNLQNKTESQQEINQQKETLQKRIDEFKKLEEEQKLLDELKKLANKLNKEDLLKKVKELSEQNKQQERSLERILELTKRFYVEQKTMQLSNKLQELSKKQINETNKDSLDTTAQKDIQKKFNKIDKELKELHKENQALKEPMPIPDTKDSSEKTKQHIEESLKSNQPKNQNNRKQSQKKSSNEMKNMSNKLQQSMMQMGAEMKEANIKSLRIILENLLNFSFKQEGLLSSFSSIDAAHPSFGKEIKTQHTLKKYFEHIDDSLYVLSMRLPEISTKIQKELSDAHYNLDQSLENFAESRFSTGISNQQFTMTAVNNLADFLSDLLDNLQKPKQSKPGKGKSKGKQFSLPDIIKKQEQLKQQLKKGTEKQKKSKDANNDGMEGELYKIYQQQQRLRQEIEEALKTKIDKSGSAKKIIKSMERLENEILEKGFSPEVITKMQQLQYNLLKLDKATFEQDTGTKRKSETNTINHSSNPNTINIKKLFFNHTEILNRQSLPLQKSYKRKVKNYFKSEKEKQGS